MKNSGKIKFKIIPILSLICAVFAMCFSFSFKTGVVSAEQTNQKVEINFVNKEDKILENDSVYAGEIYYNSAENRLENENGEELDLTVSTSVSTANSWMIYNKSETNGFEMLDEYNTNSFKLLGLVSKFYGSSDKDNYVIDGKMTVLSVKSDNLSVEMNVDQSVYEFGKIYISGVEIKNQITLIKGSEYDIKVVANKHYQVKKVKIFNGIESTPATSKEESEFSFTTGSGATNAHTIAVEYEKTTYSVNFSVRDREYNNFDGIDESAHLSIFTTAGKIDEQLKDSLSISSNNNFRYVKCVVLNNDTGLYDEVDFVANNTFDSEFYSTYAKDNVVDVFVVFDKLYEIKVSAVGTGEIIAYVNEVLVDQSAYDDMGGFTVYLSNLEDLKVYMVPGSGFVVSSISNVTDNEIRGGKFELEKVSENKEIVVTFELFYYTINVYAFDTNDQRLSHYDANTTILVNGETTEKIRIGDVLTTHTTVAPNAEYEYVGCEIYNWQGNRFETVSNGTEFSESYVRDGDNNVYVKVIYSRLYTVNVYVEKLSEGAGYFNVEILKSDYTVVSSYYNVSEFSKTISSGMKVRVTAKSYRGYAFSSFTLENTNDVGDPIITKPVLNEDVSIGIVYKKVAEKIDIISTSKHATIECLSSKNVNVGDTITISYELDFSYALKKVYINDICADKLDNVTVNDNSIMIEVTKSFLNSLDKSGNIEVEVKTVHDASFISTMVIVPMAILILIAGAIVAIMQFVKAKKKYNEISSSELLKK